MLKNIYYTCLLAFITLVLVSCSSKSPSDIDTIDINDTEDLKEEHVEDAICFIERVQLQENDESEQDYSFSFINDFSEEPYTSLTVEYTDPRPDLKNAEFLNVQTFQIKVTDSEEKHNEIYEKTNREKPDRKLVLLNDLYVNLFKEKRIDSTYLHATFELDGLFYTIESNGDVWHYNTKKFLNFLFESFGTHTNLHELVTEGLSESVDKYYITPEQYFSDIELKQVAFTDDDMEIIHQPVVKDDSFEGKVPIIEYAVHEVETKQHIDMKGQDLVKEAFEPVELNNGETAYFSDEGMASDAPEYTEQRQFTRLDRDSKKVFEMNVSHLST